MSQSRLSIQAVLIHLYFARVNHIDRPRATDDGEWPTGWECFRINVNCDTGSESGDLWERLSTLANILTLDLDSLEEKVEAAQSRIGRCFGECKKYLD